MASDTLFMPAVIVGHRFDWNYCMTPARALAIETLKRDIASVSPEQKW
ncbi:hypothetical protein ACVXHB_06865 [Escherichia coli]